MQYAIVEICADSQDCSVPVNATIFETELTDPEQILMAYVPKIEVGRGTNAVSVFINGREYTIEDVYYRGRWKFYDYG